VHALAQVAHLDVSTNLPSDTLRVRLNDKLPQDINVLSAEVVPHRFHARHHAIARRYLYQLAVRRTAFAKPYVWWIKDPLDLVRMGTAAELFLGMKNFGSFAESGDDEEQGSTKGRSTLVLLERLDIAERGDLVLVGIEGSHFLWKMVRRIVGVLVEVGVGRLDPDVVPELLTRPSDVPARLTAPASGLFLERVFYQGEARDLPLEAATPLRPGSKRRADSRS
jgi:tRNA pseudouridine38-40 synthase